MWCGEGAKSWNTPPAIRAVTGRSAKHARGNRLSANIVVEPAVPISQAKSPPLIPTPGANGEFTRSDLHPIGLCPTQLSAGQHRGDMLRS